MGEECGRGGRESGKRERGLRALAGRRGGESESRGRRRERRGEQREGDGECGSGPALPPRVRRCEEGDGHVGGSVETGEETIGRAGERFAV
jgi:hypothetical protein